MAALYDTIGVGYAHTRQPDRRIAAMIVDALGAAQSVVNVGAGTGSYEPTDRTVVAVEPSPTMLRQRPSGAAPAVRGVGGHLPFADDSFDAALATLTIHHWPDWRAGLREMLRVARERVVVLTFDPRVSHQFWLVRDYLPAIRSIATDRFSFEDVQAELGGEVQIVAVPADCTDGFLAAFWRRPERYLDPAVRAGISAFHNLPSGHLERGLAGLERDLADDSWAGRNADLLAANEYDGGYRLLIREK